MSTNKRTKKIKEWNKRPREAGKHIRKNNEQSSSVISSRISIGLFDKGTCSNRVCRDSSSRKAIRARAEGNLSEILRNAYTDDQEALESDSYKHGPKHIKKKRHKASPEIKVADKVETPPLDANRPTPSTVNTERTDHTKSKELDEQLIQWDDFARCIGNSTKKAVINYDNTLDLIQQARHIIQNTFKISRTPSTPPSTTRKVSSFMQDLDDSQPKDMRKDSTLILFDGEQTSVSDKNEPPPRCPSTCIITPKRLLQRYEKKLSQEEFQGIFVPLGPQELPAREVCTSTPTNKKERESKEPKTILVNPMKYLERCERAEPTPIPSDPGPSRRLYQENHVDHSSYMCTHGSHRPPLRNDFEIPYEDSYRIHPQQIPHYEGYTSSWFQGTEAPPGYVYPPPSSSYDRYPLFPPEPTMRTHSSLYGDKTTSLPHCPPLQRRNVESQQGHDGSHGSQYYHPGSSHYNWYGR